MTDENNTPIEDKKDDNEGASSDTQPQDRTVPLSALQAERKKRQDLEARLAEQDRLKKEEEGKFKELYEQEVKAKADLEALVKQKDTEQSIYTKAQKMGFVDPEDAVAFLKNTEIEDIEKSLNELLERKPHLAGKKSTSVGANNNTTSQQDGVKIESHSDWLKKLKNASPAEYKQIKADFESKKALGQIDYSS